MSSVNTHSCGVIEALKKFPSGALYGLAPKQYIQRGAQYYIQLRLKRFRLAEDCRQLIAEVRGSRMYTVEIIAENGMPSFYCDCPAWAPSTQCKHVVCSVLTFKNIFEPRSFGLPPLPEDYRQGLAAELEDEEFEGLKDDTYHEEEAAEVVHDMEPQRKGAQISGPAVVIRWEDGISDIFVEMDGRRLSYSQARRLPAEARILNDMGYLPPHLRINFLVDYLDSPGEKLPFVFRTRHGDRTYDFRPDFPESCFTELDSRGDMIAVGRRCIYDGRVFRPVILDDRFILDPEGGRMGTHRKAGPWPLWAELEELAHGRYERPAGRRKDRDEILIKADSFSNITILFPAETIVPKGLLLKTNGEDADIREPDITASLDIFEGPDKGCYILRAESMADGNPIPTSYRVFDFFAAVGRGSSFIRAKKRRPAIIGTFFCMLGASSTAKASAAVREGLAGEDFTRRDIKREVTHLLREHYGKYLSADRRLLFADGRWLSCPVDKALELALYKTVYDVFGHTAFEAMPSHFEMMVQAEDLFSKLPLLYEKMNALGIPLFFEGKTVDSGTWDISFDVARDGIDWFEIRPEISCNGEPIDDATWDAIIKGRQVVEQNGVMRITDANTRKVLEAISAVYGPSGQKRPKEKEIVRVPRLRVLDWLFLRSQGVKVKLPPEDEEILERLTTFEKIETKPLPDSVKARLRPYQRDGYGWLAFLYEHGFGACLADDMGLGKTLQAITFLAGLNEGPIFPRSGDKKLHLVVLPPSLLFNWENEIRRFCPVLRTMSYTGTDRTASFEGADVVLTTYAIVRRDIAILEKIVFGVVVFDEAQAVKNILADTTGAVRRLKADFKLTMTGTPLENHLGEYYSIIDLAVPGLLGEYDEFRPLINRDVSAPLNMIISRTRPFVLRRTKEKILKELPPKVETDVYLELTDRQKALYKRTVEEVRKTIDDAYRTKTQAQARIIALTAMMKLRQICVSPRLLSKDAGDHSPKIDFLIEKLRELMDEGHGSLVFSQFTSFLDLLGPELDRSHIPFIRLDGSTPVGKRKKLVEGFQKGDGPGVFLLSLKAGGQGLNLTKASYVFHIDPWWNPAVENQASDRAHRIGQKNKVTVTRMLMRHTIEEKMMALKEKKRELFRNVLDESAGPRKGAKITKADFEYLLG